MIKKIQIELLVLFLIVINVFLSYKVDVALYDYFFKINYGQETLFLKKFFIGITKLGDSFWYFIIIISILLVSFVAKKIKIISCQKYVHLRNFSIFSFIYLVLVGLVTQVLKHIIGRPRPNHTDYNEGLVFKFFSTDASFHSFPSGHSSTVFAVVLIVALLLPSLRVFFFFCGFLVALSRVVVGAHFTTDILAGAFVSIILYKIFLSFLKKYYPKISVRDFEIRNTSFLTKSNIIFFVLAILITYGNSFDIFFSGLFYYGDGQFSIQSYDFISIIFRKIFLPFLIFYIFILPIVGNLVPIDKIFFGYKFRFKEILFIWTASVATLIVVVNVLLKNLWGRARPNDILQFGGGDNFTPWYLFGDSCISNCSFVSGDASVGFSLILFYFITKKNIFIYLSLVSGVFLGFIRIIAGGHFLSDIIFSQIVVITTLFIFFILYKRLSND